MKSKAKENDPRKLEQRTKQVQYGKFISPKSFAALLLRATAGQNTLGYMCMIRYFTKCSQDGAEWVISHLLLHVLHVLELISFLPSAPNLRASRRPTSMGSEFPRLADTCFQLHSDASVRYSKRQWDGIVRSWRRQLHRWDNGTPANASPDDGAGPAASGAQGGAACDGMHGDDGELDPIMMEDDDLEEGGWAGEAALDEGIEDE